MNIAVNIVSLYIIHNLGVIYAFILPTSSSVIFIEYVQHNDHRYRFFSKTSGWKVTQIGTKKFIADLRAKWLANGFIE